MEDERGWVVAKQKVDEGLSVIRLKELEPSFPFERYPERLNVIWSFRETGPDETPAAEEMEAMRRFEDRICEYIEDAEQAVLCVVFTEPGYREYVFHSQTVELFLQALGEIPQEAEPYPIEMHHEEDPRGELYKSYATELIETT